MSNFSLTTLATSELLKLYADVMTELRNREVLRSSNNPVADYTEALVVAALQLTRAPASEAGFDATSQQGERFEIKGRRLTAQNRSTQLSAIRGIELQHFDYLVGVVLNEDFTVRYGYQIPYGVVQTVSRFRAHVNARILHLRPTLAKEAGVMDITASLVAAQQHLGSAHAASVL